MRVPFRSLLAAGAGAAALTVTVPAPSASAAAPRVDAEEACDGGLSDIMIVRGWPTVRCLTIGGGPMLTNDWWRPRVASVDVDRAAGTATVRLVRDTAPNNAWIGWTTQDATAKAGDDYTASSGELVFGGGTYAGTFTVPLLDDGDDGDGPRAFAIVFSNAEPRVDLVVPPPPATVTLAADPSYVPPAPDPDPDLDPAGPVVDPVDEGQRDEPTTPAPIAHGHAPAPEPAATAAAAPAPASARPVGAPATIEARREQERTLASTLAARTRLPVACAGPCALRSTLTVSAATAKRLGLRSRTLGAGSARGAGRVLVPLRVGARARRALAGSRRPVVVTVTVTGAGGTPLTVRLTLRPA